MIKKLLVVLSVSALLFAPACSIKSPIPENGSSVTVEKAVDGTTITTYNGNSFTTAAMKDAVDGCRVFYKDRAEKRESLAASLDSDIAKLAAYTHSETMDMIKSVWGKDICEMGTNEFDAYIAYAEEQGAVNRKAIEVAGGVVKTGVIAGFTYLGVDSLAEKLAASGGIKILGDNARLDNVNNKVVGGDHSEISVGTETESTVEASAMGASANLDQSKPSTVEDNDTHTVIDESGNTQNVVDESYNQ